MTDDGQTHQRTHTVILVQTCGLCNHAEKSKDYLARLVSNYQRSEIKRTDTHRPENEQLKFKAGLKPEI